MACQRWHSADRNSPTQLAQVANLDPWWMGKGQGQAKFHEDGTVSFDWPIDSETYQAMNP